MTYLYQLINDNGDNCGLIETNMECESKLQEIATKVLKEIPELSYNHFDLIPHICVQLQNQIDGMVACRVFTAPISI